MTGIVPFGWALRASSQGVPGPRIVWTTYKGQTECRSPPSNLAFHRVALPERASTHSLPHFIFTFRASFPHRRDTMLRSMILFVVKTASTPHVSTNGLSATAKHMDKWQTGYRQLMCGTNVGFSDKDSSMHLKRHRVAPLFFWKDRV